MTQTLITHYMDADTVAASPIPGSLESGLVASATPALSKSSEKVVRTSEDSSLGSSVGASQGNKTNTNTSSSVSPVKTIMHGHHIRFYARYKGSQPGDSECSVKPIGKGNWSKHVWKRQTYTIVVGTKTIEVCLEHDGSAFRVKEKADQCRELAERILKVFSQEHHIELTSPVELGGYSHWVIGHKKTSDLLKPLCKKPKNDKVGAVYGDSSHPEAVEFIGSHSLQAAEGMDGLLIELPTMINAWNQGQVRYMQEMKILLGAIGESIKLQTELLGRLSK